MSREEVLNLFKRGRVIKYYEIATWPSAHPAHFLPIHLCLLAETVTESARKFHISHVDVVVVEGHPPVLGCPFGRPGRWKVLLIGQRHTSETTFAGHTGLADQTKNQTLPSAKLSSAGSIYPGYVYLSSSIQPDCIIQTQTRHQSLPTDCSLG